MDVSTAESLEQLDSVDSLSICPSTGLMVNDFDSLSFTQGF